MELGTTFDLAPVPMWIEDFSGVRAQLELWRQAGVTDLRAFLEADLTRVAESAARIRVLRVNRAVLDLFEARDADHLVSNLDRVFRNEMLETHIAELCQLWAGQTAFRSSAVNYTLGGRRLHVQLKAAVFPGHEDDLARMLVTTEDVTPREEAREAERTSRLGAEGLFRHSPVSLWIEDFSRIRLMLGELRRRGISDLRVFTDVHPEFVRQCMQAIRVLEVNEATLDLFVADSQETLLRRLPEVFRDEMESHFREQLIELWSGNLHHSREVVNYALDGSERVVIMRFAVMPGHEGDWSRVLIALTDITARKKAEAYLAYLGKHDVLTGLNNRGHFIEQLNMMMRQNVRPLSMAIIDLDGLKEANDQFGHDTGDQLLRRTGEVLREAVADTACDAARIGGDEFAVLMPYCTEGDAQALVAQLHSIVAVNNTFYSARPLSLSIGCATLHPNETQDSLVRRADKAMYAHKREGKVRGA